MLFATSESDVLPAPSASAEQACPTADWIFVADCICWQALGKHLKAGAGANDTVAHAISRVVDQRAIELIHPIHNIIPFDRTVGYRQLTKTRSLCKGRLMPDRYLSEVLQEFPNIAHHTAPLLGVEAEIYNRLWRTIIEGKIRPGFKLQEDIICETFQVSRTVVRKVLIIMEQEGIVELPANRGAYVATPSPRDAREVFETLRMLNRHIVTQLASPDRSLDPDDIKRLKKHIALQEAAECSGDFALSTIMSSEFYILLAHIHGNTIIAAQYEALITRLVMVTMKYHHASSFFPGRANFEGKLVEQILDHDQDAAVATITDRLDFIERSLRFEQSDGAVDFRAILEGSPSKATPPASKRYGARKQKPD